MYSEVILKYFNPLLKIGMQDIRQVWLLSNEPVKLITTVHQGNLVYRIPGTRRRISYRSLKKGLVKKTIVLKQSFNILPF
jgi:hypothetical protein